MKRLAEAQKTYQSVRTLVMPMHRTIRAGRPLNVDGVNASLRRIVPQVARHDDALMWLTNLDKKDDQVVRHSINVCILALVFGKHLGLANDVLQDLAFGALLHDIGKIKVSRRLLNHTGQLNASDREELNRHVEYGIELLKGSQFNDRISDIMRLHHEHFAGGGFPSGIELNQPEHQLAQIVAIIDAYDTLVRSRSGGGITADRAITMLREQRGKKFHPGLLDSFVDYLGDMPVGNLLELNSGRDRHRTGERLRCLSGILRCRQETPAVTEDRRPEISGAIAAGPAHPADAQTE